MPTFRAKYQRWSGTIALVAVAVSSAVGLHFVDNEAKARSSVDRARTTQLKWERQQADAQACVRSADGRAEVRRTFDEVFDSIARYADPERRAEVRRFVAAEKLLIADALPPVDCSKVAPAPKGPRPKIPG